LKFFPTSEGYFNVETGKYVYNYTDHLGNIRLSYAKNGAGTEIIEESNYYPFGLKHEGYNVLLGNSAYKYKYNGKELQESGMYDYGARMYMADIVRWGVVDPLAEKHFDLNPMMYAANNPIMMIDPDGRDWSITESYDKKTNTTHYQLSFTGAVLNSSSNKKIDMKKFASAIQSQTEEIFNKLGTNPYITVSANIDIRAIDDKDNLRKNDTLIEIKDSTAPEFDAFKNGEKANAYTLNGKEISVNADYASDAIGGKNIKFIPHEIGHSAGLHHPVAEAKASNGGFLDLNYYYPAWDVPKNNFMFQGNMKVSGLTVNQLRRMNRLYKAGKLNQKTINPAYEK
jgi:RHS repeat-associated protein